MEIIRVESDDLEGGGRHGIESSRAANQKVFHCTEYEEGKRILAGLTFVRPPDRHVPELKSGGWDGEGAYRDPVT